MKQAALLDVPRDRPTRSRRLKILKREHCIETHHSSACPEQPWLACHMPSARQIAEGYEDNFQHAQQMGLYNLVAGYCRLLEESSVMVEGRTEREAIDNLIEHIERWREPSQ